ncbi:hypothetical protein NP233_g4239 [Leucocoprinus birnbaumii]|uniref:Uncharacterized protein n=1 Tax=Leucocoprinus birnbaumii TaxID=56174 RepID=A0AAD5VXS5_9AGAR|nr:hypothetical protein NP233_g4239 [Leucocoprinus birnbaumii]
MSLGVLHASTTFTAYAHATLPVPSTADKLHGHAKAGGEGRTWSNLWSPFFEQPLILDYHNKVPSIQNCDYLSGYNIVGGKSINDRRLYKLFRL